MGSEGWLEKLVQDYSQGGGSVPTKQGKFQIMFGLLQDPYSQFFCSQMSLSEGVNEKKKFYSIGWDFVAF